MNSNAHGQWEELYRAAVLELDPKKLVERIEVAEQSIREQLGRLEDGPGSADRNEKQSMYDALQTLSDLRRLGSRNDPSRPR